MPIANDRSQYQCQNQKSSVSASRNNDEMEEVTKMETNTVKPNNDCNEEAKISSTQLRDNGKQNIVWKNNKARKRYKST